MIFLKSFFWWLQSVNPSIKQTSNLVYAQVLTLFKEASAWQVDYRGAPRPAAGPWSAGVVFAPFILLGNELKPFARAGTS